LLPINAVRLRQCSSSSRRHAARRRVICRWNGSNRS
jgi:hypothetical protein